LGAFLALKRTGNDRNVAVKSDIGRQE